MRTAILISGRGSNMASLIQAARDPAYPAEIVLVLSNDPEALGLERARDAGVDTLAIDHRPFRTARIEHERLIQAALESRRVELVALAGYMRVLTPWFVQRWSGRMINIHPSLLPDFPGLHTHSRALEAGVAVHGCTVHWVTEGLDAGPVLGRAEVCVEPTDDADSLGARVLATEHRLYPECLAEAAQCVRSQMRSHPFGNDV